MFSSEMVKTRFLTLDGGYTMQEQHECILAARGQLILWRCGCNLDVVWMILSCIYCGSEVVAMSVILIIISPFKTQDIVTMQLVSGPECY